MLPVAVARDLASSPGCAHVASTCTHFSREAPPCARTQALSAPSSQARGGQGRKQHAAAPRGRGSSARPPPAGVRPRRVRERGCAPRRTRAARCAARPPRAPRAALAPSGEASSTGPRRACRGAPPRGAAPARVVAERQPQHHVPARTTPGCRAAIACAWRRRMRWRCCTHCCWPSRRATARAGAASSWRRSSGTLSGARPPLGASESRAAPARRDGGRLAWPRRRDDARTLEGKCDHLLV